LRQVLSTTVNAAIALAIPIMETWSAIGSGAPVEADKVG